MQGLGPYSASIKKAEKEIKEMAKKVNDLCGMCLSHRYYFTVSILLKGLTWFCYCYLDVIDPLYFASIFLKIGIKESDTGLAAPSQWDLVSDKQMMQEEQPLQVWVQSRRFSQ